VRDVTEIAKGEVLAVSASEVQAEQGAVDGGGGGGAGGDGCSISGYPTGRPSARQCAGGDRGVRNTCPRAAARVCS
jgi:hypothetical protein